MASRSVLTVAAAALALVLPDGGDTFAAVGCRPAAIVTGEESVAVPVRAYLSERGIASVTDATCPVVRAQVHTGERGLVVVIQDAHDRRSERTVADVATTATLIESWVRSDVSGPLLAGSTASAPVATDDETPSVLRPTIVRAAQPRPASVALAGTTSLASDGSLWLGVEIAGCIRLGRICVGVSSQVNQDVGVTGDSEKMETSRLGVDLLVTAEAPIRWRGVSLAPGVGLGLGWMRSSSVRDGLAAGDHIDVDSGGLRANVHVSFSVPLGSGLTLDLGLAAEASPLAHSAPFQTDGVVLTGEPRGFVRAGLGLRYGAP